MDRRTVAGVFCLALFCCAGAFAQTGSWLDAVPMKNWNKAVNRMPVPDKRVRPNVAECRRTVRPSTTFADTLLARSGMLPVGEALVFGKTLVVTGTKDFDGMCRPVMFQTFVFHNSRLAGTLSPVLMNSRTDGALQDVSIGLETRLMARYSRYAESDALCCPSRTDIVWFEIRNGVLTPMSTDSAGGADYRIKLPFASTRTYW